MKLPSSLRVFRGATAIVTGGASGIGRALGAALVARGAAVVLADRQGDLAETVATELRARGGAATAAEVDVRDFAALTRLIRETMHLAGRLDYLFNNAGIGIGGEVADYQLGDWDEVFAVNVRGVTNGIQAAYPVMLRQGFGHIVNTASVAGLLPTPGGVGYCASKHAVVGLSTALRIEAAPAGVRVSVLCPGIVRSPALADGGRYGKLLRSIPPNVQRRAWERLHPIEPDACARQALRGVARNRAVIIVPPWWKAVWWLNRLSPTLGGYLMQRAFEGARRVWMVHPRAPAFDPADETVSEKNGTGAPSPTPGVEAFRG